jgi:hypothetical protein
MRDPYTHRQQALPDLKQVVLARIEQDNAGGRGRGDRFDESRSNIAARAGYQNCLARARGGKSGARATFARL